MKKDNILLIGMPGSGKTTYGKLLAEKLGFKFIDCDEYVEQKEKMSLQEIIDIKGDEEFLKIEEKRNLELLSLKNYILASGGSVVYIEKLMKAFKKSSFIIFLDTPLEIIEKRLVNKATRGIVRLKSKPIKELYRERVPLYKKYADIIVNCSKKSDSEIIEEIVKKEKIEVVR